MVTVAVVSPGAMGSALGRGWAEGGARVLATVTGRSTRTAALARGLELVPSLLDAVGPADVVVSIVPPAEAVRAAAAIRAATVAAGVTPVVADLNAVSPATLREVARALDGLDLVDGSVSGPPPDRPGTRLYLSGPRADELLALAHPRLDVRVLPGPVGAASALKMSTASVYKGTSALFLHAMVTAQANGVLDDVLDDLSQQFPGQTGGMARLLPLSASKADRYVEEMREIAATQQHAGLPPELFEAMALVWQQVAQSPLAGLTPEQASAQEDLVRVLDGLRAHEA